MIDSQRKPTSLQAGDVFKWCPSTGTITFFRPQGDKNEILYLNSEGKDDKWFLNIGGEGSHEISRWLGLIARLFGLAGARKPPKYIDTPQIKYWQFF